VDDDRGDIEFKGVTSVTLIIFLKSSFTAGIQTTQLTGSGHTIACLAWRLGQEIVVSTF
jgi:hypothetical protein